jgi:hypothetical protein
VNITLLMLKISDIGNSHIFLSLLKAIVFLTLLKNYIISCLWYLLMCLYEMDNSNGIRFLWNWIYETVLWLHIIPILWFCTYKVSLSYKYNRIWSPQKAHIIPSNVKDSSGMCTSWHFSLSGFVKLIVFYIIGYSCLIFWCVLLSFRCNILRLRYSSWHGMTNLQDSLCAPVIPYHTM